MVLKLIKPGYAINSRERVLIPEISDRDLDPGGIVLRLP
jgi:hypothetical protein